MSEIFYTEVDKNLRAELNARAAAGHNRTTKDLNYMLGKVTNVKLTAYDNTDTEVDSYVILHVLGGKNVRNNNYLPTGESQGYLDSTPVTAKELAWTLTAAEENGQTKHKSIPILRTKTTTTNYRTPPFISSAQIDIGDHSMGLLNTGLVVIEIPDVNRDLDIIEEIYMRPGRKIRLDAEQHPDAIITGLSLDKDTIPSAEDIKKLYGDKIDTEERIKDLSKMNRISFEGLITSFDLQFNDDFSMTLTVNMRGTSNVLADVTVFTNSTVTEENNQGKTTVNPVTNPEEYTAAVTVPSGSGLTSFFDQLFTESEQFIKVSNAASNNNDNILIGSGDDWVLFGNAWASTGTKPTADQKTYSRYITLGRLINFINTNVTAKLAKTTAIPKILCDSSVCFSSYYENIVSVDPWNVLLLPSQNKKGTTEKYGDKQFFETTNFGEFPGFLGSDRSYPSRIFLSLSMIREIITETEKNKNKNYSIGDFLKEISYKIEAATAGAIILSLITWPKSDILLAFYDSKYLGQPENLSKVKPYHVPMHAKLKTNGSEESFGTIVTSFKFSAKLPDSAATLSYVLNQNPDEISEEDIAPYVNAMYQFNSPEKLEKALNKFSEVHNKYLEEFKKQKTEYGKNLTDDTIRTKLKESLIKHLQYPYPTLKDSVQAVAPIFPWDTSFSIEGISGFRYGDVLIFDILPEKYKVNTVFSIIGITHEISTDGQWKTNIKCIMRPRLDTNTTNILTS